MENDLINHTIQQDHPCFKWIGDGATAVADSLHAKLVAPELTEDRFKGEMAAAMTEDLKWLEQLHSEHVGTVKPPSPHRQKCPDHSKIVMPSFAVARKVPKSEWMAEEAQKAIAEEVIKQTTAPWPKCSVRNPTGKGQGTWYVESVREEKSVVQESKDKGTTIHLAYGCILLYEKGSELPKGHEDRKTKARTVLLGNDVKDAWFEQAEMEGLGSAPPAMEDNRALDVKSLQPGYTQSDSDAESAYLQEYLKSKHVTWFHPPVEFWPAHWHGK
jgi:hypothetical protein